MGIVIDETNYIKTKWDETEVGETCNCYITRNGEKFFNVLGNTLDYCLNEARSIIYKLEGFPINFFSMDFLNEIENRKIFWKEQPAIITKYLDGGNVLIKSENPNGFNPPCYLDKEDLEQYEEDRYEVVDFIFSNSIWWFRD
ncbi:hypothetical protein B7C51_24640 (plasmid) [Paenibacillus larvae subsp. pulvifaciens]|uniref:Uncharacterized protein n=1 Tax=Paenibacillus larvae subsp. pulvifaciens TaxID=1477 RepID=A0A1V0UZL3_9BACL|nr:hypothetical protein [Paenibacillus larvae]ARF70665.1 hypothetical protein B7C51_24640 [Paenibacillus larvae subsp. pulvifaciens]